MFPIRDHNPSFRTPYVTYGLIVANIVMYILTMPAIGGEMLWYRLALYPVAVTNGEMMWGLLTHMFMHAGLLHIAGNMLFLYIFGDNLEEQLGHLVFLLFYLAAGLAAAGAQIMADPQSAVPMVGASGAVAGVMGGYLLLFPRARVDVVLILVIYVRMFTLPAWVVLAFWFGLQIFGGFMLQGGDGGVAYWAHAGGFIAGLLFAAPRFLQLGGTGFWQLTEGHPPHPGTAYSESRIPRINRR